MNRAINQAIREWLERLEAKEDTFSTFDGYKITKPAGMPYPQRHSDAVRQGPPAKEEREAQPERDAGLWASTSARLEPELHERLTNAVYWRDTLRSHDVEVAVTEWLDSIGSGRV